jgi:integrase
LPIRFFESPGELARLLAAAPDSFKPVLAIQAFAGLRSAEVMRLDWQNVKLARGHIEITAANAKTASRRIVPILPNLAAWLKDAAKKSGKIFPHTCRCIGAGAPSDNSRIIFSLTP